MMYVQKSLNPVKQMQEDLAELRIVPVTEPTACKLGVLVNITGEGTCLRSAAGTWASQGAWQLGRLDSGGK